MTSSLSRSWVAIVSLIFLTPCLAIADEDKGASVYKIGLKSACFVYTPKVGSGSGSLIDKQKRYVITNNHVVGSAETVIVHFPMYDAKGKVIVERDKYKQNISSNKGIRGKVLVREETRDLAIIQLERLPPGVVAVNLATESPAVGEHIHSIGNPGASDAAWVYTDGKVRQVYEKKWAASGGGSNDISNHKAVIIEATSPVSPGDSGGPLFNSKGQQIGVTQGMKASLSAQGYSYFIDITEVRRFLKDRKITLSIRKDEPTPEPMTEIVDKPKPEPMDDPKPEPKTITRNDPPKKKTPPKADPADVEQDAMEKKANLELSLLRGIARDPNKRELAVDKLQALIKKYPKTKAAKEAKELVRRLDQ